MSLDTDCDLPGCNKSLNGPSHLDYFFHGGLKRALIIQSAGEVHENDTEAVPEEDECGSYEAGNYLLGAAMNAAIVQNYLVTNYKLPQSCIESYNFSVACDKNPIDVILSALQRDKRKCIIYYTGHGDKHGAWHFTLYEKNNKKITVTPDDVLQIASNSSNPPWIISQSCFSGHWIGWEKFCGFSSAMKTEKSRSSERGSEFTRWLFKGESYPEFSTPKLTYGSLL